MCKTKTLTQGDILYKPDVSWRNVRLFPVTFTLEEATSEMNSAKLEGRGEGISAPVRQIFLKRSLCSSWDEFTACRQSVLPSKVGVHRWQSALPQKRLLQSAAAARDQRPLAVNPNQHEDNYSNQSIKKQTYIMYLPPSFVLFSWLGSKSRELTFLKCKYSCFYSLKTSLSRQ